MKYFKKINLIAISLIVVFGLLSSAQAGQITATSVSGSGSYYNSVTLLTDGYVPPEWTGWTEGTNVWWYGTAPAFTLDFGMIYNLTGILIQVDNNDDYVMQYSQDNSAWNNLFYIPYHAGNVGWGMDTFTVQENIFSPVNARYIRAFAVSGDNCYAISEIQAFGTAVNTVPEPASMLLLGIGLAGLAGIRKKFKK
jgi:hypothetical protein